MDHGRLQAYGSINDIMRQMNQGRTILLRPLEMSEALIRMLNENPNVSGLVENVTDVEFRFTGEDADTARLLGELIARGIPVLSFHEREGNLEEMFMQLTGGEEKLD